MLCEMLRSRRFLHVAPLLAALVGAAPGCSPERPERPEAPARRPDIVLISLDSTRADALSFRDEQATPHLTALAKRGTIFEQAMSGSSWTLPGHAEMFTGSPPALHGVMTDRVGIDALQPTVTELLHARGYHTMGYFSGLYLDPRYGFRRGFDSYKDGRLAASASGEAEDEGEGEGEGEPQFFGADTIVGPRIADLAEADLPGVPTDQPLFVFAHVFDPHYDYIPPAPFDTRFDPDYDGDMDGRDYYTDLRVYDAQKSPHRQVSDRDLEHLRALYQGELAFTDQSIGRLLASLEALGRLKNALIVVTSDHGEEFFEHGNRGHRNGLFDEVLHVPLLIVPPAGSAPEGSANPVISVADQVSLSDIAPTLLDFAGVTPPPTMSGRSLRGALDGAALERRPVYSTLTGRVTEKGEQVLVLSESLRWPESKLLIVSRYDPKAGFRLSSATCFNLLTDPGETAPASRAPGRDPIIKAQWHALEEVLDGLRAHYAAMPHSPDDERGVSARPASDDALRALGYLGTEHVKTDSGMLLPPWGLGPRTGLPASN